MKMMTIISKIKNCKKYKVIFRLKSNNKKFAIVRFHDKEMDIIEKASIVQGITVEQFFQKAIQDIAEGKKSNTNSEPY
jgi:hypothetical protein